MSYKDFVTADGVQIAQHTSVRFFRLCDSFIESGLVSSLTIGHSDGRQTFKASVCFTRDGGAGDVRLLVWSDLYASEANALRALMAQINTKHNAALETIAAKLAGIGGAA